MSRQITSQEWKIVTTLFDQRAQKFSVIRRNFGKYTAATAIDKAAQDALQRGYFWKAKSFHGLGGYWVNGNGDTIELLPGRV